jgi:hypothetical protein
MSVVENGKGKCSTAEVNGVHLEEPDSDTPMEEGSDEELV